jgi:hypothetical protein
LGNRPAPTGSVTTSTGRRPRSGRLRIVKQVGEDVYLRHRQPPRQLRRPLPTTGCAPTRRTCPTTCGNARSNLWQHLVVAIRL